MKRPVGLFIFIVFLTAFAGFFVWPQGFGVRTMPWRLGLDLIGGAHLVYEVDMANVAPEDRASTLEGLRDVMERRVNVFGVSEPLVATAKSGDAHRIIVELAGIEDVSEAVAQIGRTALLEFREIDAAHFAEGAEPVWLDTGLTGRFLSSAQVVADHTTGQAQILVRFNSEGAARFEEITGRNVGAPLAIFLDGEIISAPVVQQKIIGNEAVISGQFTVEEARNLASLLNAGALPAPVELVSQQKVGASLGLDSLNRTIMAGLVGTLAVILFILVYYGKLGIFAALALIAYVILTLAVFKGVSMTMTLAGIAGFVLSIGMAVDANILIFERTKEELRRGVSRVMAIEEGFQRAWPSIRDSNITTIITSLLLYYLTTSFVKGFALALLIGVVVSMFTAVTITRTLLRVFVKNS